MDILSALRKVTASIKTWADSKLETKLDKNLGTDNAGKVLTIGDDGNIKSQMLDTGIIVLSGTNDNPINIDEIKVSGTYLIKGVVTTSMDTTSGSDSAKLNKTFIDGFARGELMSIYSLQDGFVNQLMMNPTRPLVRLDSGEGYSDAIDASYVQPVEKTTEMTQPVGIRSDGQLFTEPFNQVQSDWNENDESSLAHVKNRTHWLDKGRVVTSVDAGYTTSETLYLQEGSTYTLVQKTDGMIYDSKVFNEDFTSLEYGSVVFKITEDYKGSGSYSCTVSNRYSDITRDFVVYENYVYHQLDGYYLPFPSDDKTKPGAVKAQKIDNSEYIGNYRPIYHQDGMAYTFKDTIYFREFSLGKEDLVVDLNVREGRRIICERPGDLSTYFPEWTETSYPVAITQWDSSSGGLLIDTADGERYTCYWRVSDDVVTLSNVTNITSSFSRKMESVELLSNITKGTATYDSIELVEGDLYTCTYTDYSATQQSVTMTAAYNNSLGMVVCLADGNASEPTNNRFYVGDTQSYVNPSWVSGLRISNINFYGKKIIPSIPIQAILDIAPSPTPDVPGPVIADPATSEDTIPARVGSDGKLYVKGQVQSDWNENDETNLTYVKNRTHYDSREKFEISSSGENVDCSGLIKISDEVMTLDKLEVSRIEMSLSIPSESINFDNAIFDYDGFVNPSETILGVYYRNEDIHIDLSIIVNSSTTADAGMYLSIDEIGTGTYSMKLYGEVGELKTLDPKYIKDMYYTEMISEFTFLDGTFDFVDSGGMYYYEQENSLIIAEGKTYTVIFDGTSYSCTSYIPIEGQSPVLGNASIAEPSLPSGNNEPFFIFTGDGFLQILTNLTSTSHTVKITGEGEIVHKLDEKYLSETPSSKMNKENPTGTGSFSLNRRTDTVIGAMSFAEGSDTTASGDKSHAEGTYTTASSYSSHAEGAATTASGDKSHAEGGSTTASGENSHAEGGSTNKFSSVVTATNPTNTAIITAWKNKKFSVAKGTSSHVEGRDNLALGNYSHAEGFGTTVSGDMSHAEGFYTTVSGVYSHAEGNYTTASGSQSHAEGWNTTVSGNTSHAEGFFTKASGAYQHTQGKYNVEDSAGTYADIIGNGTSSKRSNAATVDWSGNAWYAGDVYVGSTSGTNKDAGSKKLATEEYVNSVVSEIPSGGGDIPTALPNPYALTFIGAVTGSYDGSQAVTVEIPSGGGESAFRLINTVNITEEVSTITIDKDSNGNAFEISEVLIYFDSTTYATADGTFYFRPLGQSSYNMACYNFISKTAGGNYQRWIYAKHIANGFWRAEFIMNTGHNVPLYSNPGETITSFQLLGQTLAAGNIYIYGRSNGGGGGTTTHGIIWDLVNVTSSNTVVSVSDGASLVAVLTPADGYTLGDVTVTMGGEVITGAWNADTTTVTIQSVTGDVIISCAGVEQTVDTSPVIAQSDVGYNASGAVKPFPGVAITKYYEFTPDIDGIKASGHYDETNDYTTSVGTTGSVVAYTPNTKMVEAGYSTSGMTSNASKFVLFRDGVVAATMSNACLTGSNQQVTLQFARQNTNAMYANSLAFTISELDADDSYAYWTTNNYKYTVLPVGVREGDIIFAGKNTPYYGMVNIDGTMPGGESAAVLSFDNDIAQDYGVSTLSLTPDLSADTITAYGLASAYASVLETIRNEWMIGYNGNVNKIPIIIHTDQHGRMTNSGNVKGLFNTIGKAFSLHDISKIMNLGDTVSVEWEDTDTNHPLLSCTALENYLSTVEAIPFSKRLEVFGNHDTWYYNGYNDEGNAIGTRYPSTQNHLYKYFRNIYKKSNGNNTGYFTVCDDYFNVKYVVVSAYEYQNGTISDRMTSKQIEWIIREFSKDDGYDIVVVSHCPLYWDDTTGTFPEGAPTTTATLRIANDSIDSLWAGRKNKTSGTVNDSDGGTHTFDFTNCTSDLLCALHGHTHRAGYNYVSDSLLSVAFDWFANESMYFCLIDRENRELKVWKFIGSDGDAPEYLTWTAPFDKQ